MEASGATQTIANSILKVMGKDSPYKGLLAITLIASILTYGGVSIFVVIFLPCFPCHDHFSKN